MKWAYNVVAYDESGNPLKEMLRTVVRSKAEATLEKLEDALERRTKHIDGVRVAEYSIEKDYV